MGQAIAFAQQKGGAGKTTLLAHLAHGLAAGGASVTLLDLDPQGSLTAWASMGGVERISRLETSSYRVAGDMRDAKEAGDYVLVDCPGNVAPVLEAALRETDLMIVPCQPSVLDLWATQAILDMAAEEKVPARILFNRVPPRGSDTKTLRTTFRKGGAEILRSEIGNRVAYARGLGTGGTALSLPGQPVAKKEIAAFVREVGRVLGKL